MRATTLSKFEVNLTHGRINLGMVTEAAVRLGARAIVALPDQVDSLLIQRGLLRAQHKVICALDLEGKHFGFEKLTRTKVNATGADGFEITLSQGRSSIEILNEIKVLSQFLRGNNPLIDVRWVINVSQRQPEDVAAALQHLGQFPPTAVRLDRGVLPVNAYAELISTTRKYCKAPFKIAGSEDNVRAYVGNAEIVAFDIFHEQMSAMAQLVNTVHLDKPIAKTPIEQMSVGDLEKELTHISKHPEIPVSKEQVIQYMRRCKVHGETAAPLVAGFEDVLAACAAPPTASSKENNVP